MIKVALVEDDPSWMKEMVKFLSKENDMSVVATAENREGAVKLAESIEIDIFLMDINLTENNVDGIDAALDILELGKSKVIMLTVIKEEKVIRNSFTAGAVNYICKENYRAIPKVIREVYNNKSPIEVLVKDYMALKEEQQLKDLTDSEKEVYTLIEQGYSRTQIQEKLYKTENTIKGQIKNILKKLNVSNCKDAIRKVKRKGL